MLITIEKQQPGYVVRVPSTRLRVKLEAYLAHYGEAERAQGIYYQSLEELTEAHLYNLNSNNIKDLSRGLPVTKRICPWLFGQGVVGYDAGDERWWE